MAIATSLTTTIFTERFWHLVQITIPLFTRLRHAIPRYGPFSRGVDDQNASEKERLIYMENLRSFLDRSDT